MNQHTLDILEYLKIKEMLEAFTVSDLGRDLVRALKPETDISIIRNWLMETGESRALLDKGASVPLSSLDGIGKVLEKLGKVTALLPEDLAIVKNVLVGTGRIMGYMKARTELAPHVASYAASMFPLEDLASEIDRCIRDSRVDDKASPELARIRKRIAVVEERITSKLESILRSPDWQSKLQDAVVSIRGGSYVIPVKREHRRSVDGAVADTSSSGSTVFIEPAAIRSLKNELNLLKLEEEKEVFRILSWLTGLAEGYKREITINVQTMAHYDFLFARAKLANAMKAVCPEINEDRRIEILGGRHPLLGEAAVPLDFRIGEDYEALIITGPNTGGKTVVLKTVGLFCLMAQSGLHVPAAFASLPVFRDVLADIGDGQSITQSLSTFSSHIRNIISIIRCAGPDTLVILDELGTGTDPAEGMGLAVAVLEELKRKGSIILATTHYSEIKAFASMTPGFRNGCMLFDPDSLMPLYRLSIGIPGESNAFLIALRLGMDPEIISRAHEITYKEKKAYQAPPQASGSCGNIGSTAKEAFHTIQAHTGRVEPAAQSHEKSERHREHRKKAEKTPIASSFKVGDCVFVTSMNRTGIVCEPENARGDVGVLIMKKRFVINKKRLRPYIDGKDLYPEDYDLSIVLDSKENRKKRRIMSKRHVEGLTIEVHEGTTRE
ncbi:MAG TPA: DNA mismatch repair protein MutS [Thermoclostridium caenicola]|nr:DNA mismatch repair protein MutS [Thermoclostridium caenicola]